MESETLKRIKELINGRNMDSQPLIQAKKCELCRGYGWIKNDEDRYRRCECVEIERIKGYWKSYGVKPEDIKPLREYNAYNSLTSAVKSMAASYITHFNEVRAEENNWFGLFGQPGSGKSHIAISMGAALLKSEPKAVKVVYMPYLEVMREMKANAREEEYYLSLLFRYQRSEVLIIDDLFKDKVRNGKLAFELTEIDIKHIYPIINYRYYNKMPTFISSECTPEMLLELDEALAGRILERCDRNITIFEGDEYNYRLKKFKKA